MYSIALLAPQKTSVERIIDKPTRTPCARVVKSPMWPANVSCSGEQPIGQKQMHTAVNSCETALELQNSSLLLTQQPCDIVWCAPRMLPEMLGSSPTSLTVKHLVIYNNYRWLCS